jgi:hypothetical protein
VEDAFSDFVDHKWKVSLNMAAAEPTSWDYLSNLRRVTDGPKKGESERPQIRKTTTAGVHATAASDQGNGGGAMPRGREKAPLKCKFA